MAKIQPWEAEVDEGSATPTPVKKPMPKPAPKPMLKPKTVPVGQAEVDDGMVYKKAGGMISNVDYVKSLAGGKHHSEDFKAHAAGHGVHHEFVKNFGKR
jgi:hypothetical protein